MAQESEVAETAVVDATNDGPVIESEVREAMTVWKGAQAAGDTLEDNAEAGKSTGTSGDDVGSDAGNVIWPDNWRDQMSGGDAKIAEELGRYAEPGLIGPALVEAKKKISAGLSPEPLAENATDEQVAEYRKKNGIPAEPGGYFENLPEGIVVGDEDKAGMEKLATAMHAAHQPPAAVHAAMGVYYQHLSDAMAERAEIDATDKRDTDDALNEIYGNEFRRNINDMGAWLDSAGEEVKASILSARTPEGQRLGNDPNVIKWLVSQMRLIQPLVTVPGLGPGEPGAALEDEITKIEERIQNDNPGYRADKKTQARYLELLTAREKRN